jgi:hypothetical protein
MTRIWTLMSTGDYWSLPLIHRISSLVRTVPAHERSNSALVNDACASALLRRAFFSAPQRER